MESCAFLGFVIGRNSERLVAIESIGNERASLIVRGITVQGAFETYPLLRSKPEVLRVIADVPALTSRLSTITIGKRLELKISEENAPDLDQTLESQVFEISLDSDVVVCRFDIRWQSVLVIVDRNWRGRCYRHWRRM